MEETHVVQEEPKNVPSDVVQHHSSSKEEENVQKEETKTSSDSISNEQQKKQGKQVEEKNSKKNKTSKKKKKSQDRESKNPVGQKENIPKKSKSAVKEVKVLNNWHLSWVRVKNCLEQNQDIWVQKWVRITQPEEKPVVQEKKQQQKIYKCKFPLCSKVFNDQSKLRKHQIHHGEKQFICKIEGCNRAFLDKSKLKRHKLVHTKERHYQCEICGKRFSLDFNLRTHMRTHTGQKPFQCDFPGCSKRFTQSSNLAAHNKTHQKGGSEKKERKTRKKKFDQDIESEILNELKKLKSETGDYFRMNQLQGEEVLKLKTFDSYPNQEIAFKKEDL